MRTFLTALMGGVCSLFVFFGLLFAIIVPIAASVFAGGLTHEPTRPAGDVILAVDLRQPYPDQGQSLSLPMLSSLGHVDILTRLEAARHDHKVKGVILRVDWNGPGYARSEEIRQAVLRFRQSGKFVYAHAQNLGLGLSGYRAIAAADKIAMQPGSEFFVSGTNIETLFLKDALDKIGVRAEFEAVGDYKSGPDIYTRNDYSDAQRQELDAILVSLLDEAIADISADRDMSAANIQTHFAETPLSASEAQSRKLIDALAWPEDFVETAREQAEGADILPIQAYRPPDVAGPVVALISGQGPITTGREDYSSVSSNQILSDPMAATILQAGEDESVKALVVRIDSPGGSPAASEQIRRAIVRVREGQDEEEGKPVIVSMGSVAASGGYWVALAGDYLLASRTSLTGSIGVYGGKLAVADGLRKLGVEPRQISRGGPMVSAFSSEALTPVQRTRFRQMLERTYAQFTELVAQARNLSQAQAEAVAGGRVWTGAQAQGMGLIDETGGLIKAVEKAAELANIEQEQINLKSWNPEPDLLGVISSFLNVSAVLADAVRVMDLRNWQALMGVWSQAGQPGPYARAAPITAE